MTGDEKHADQTEGIISLDALVDSFGGCGQFQIWLVLATYSTHLIAAWGMFLMAFGSYHPGWQCGDSSGLQKYPEMVNGTSEHFYQHDNVTNSSFLLHDEIKNRSQNNYLSSTDQCDILDQCKDVQFDSGVSTVVTEWTLICDKSWIPSVIISVQMVGVFIGSYLGGYMGDRYGRRITLYGNVAACAVFNVVAVFSVSWEMFLVVRFLLGMGVAGILATSFMYPIEFMNQWGRGVLGSLPFWNLGAATFSVVVLIFKDWKHVHIASAVLSVVLFIPVFWVPESLRWLSVHGQIDRAKQVAYRVSRRNKRPPPNTVLLEAIAEEEQLKADRGDHGRQYSLTDLFKTKSMRKVSIIMGFFWACMAMVYYAISFGIKSLTGDFFINLLIFSVCEIPGMLFVAPASNKLGRRLGTLVYFLVITTACLSVVLVFFFAPESVKGTIITVLALIAKMLVAAVWILITIYCSELYPTVVRNIGIGYLNSSARIGGIIAPYLIPNEPDILYIPFLIMGVVLMICCVLLMLLPETKGRQLEDTIRANSNIIHTSKFPPDDITL